jgi:pilus assembly protein Flp/PilA
MQSKYFKQAKPPAGWNPNPALAALHHFLHDESGQDLVEYALVVALISLGATASMSAVATSISAAFSSVGNKVGTYIT